MNLLLLGVIGASADALDQVRRSCALRDGQQGFPGGGHLGMHTALAALRVRLFPVFLLFAVQELNAGDTVNEAALEQIRDMVEDPNCEVAATSAIPLPMCRGKTTHCAGPRWTQSAATSRRSRCRGFHRTASL